MKRLSQLVRLAVVRSPADGDLRPGDSGRIKVLHLVSLSARGCRLESPRAEGNSASRQDRCSSAVAQTTAAPGMCCVQLAGFGSCHTK